MRVFPVRVEWSRWLTLGVPGALLALLLAFVAGLVGTSRAPEDSLARLAALQAEGRTLDDVTDLLETRLLAGQAQVNEWGELGRRHREVSETACRVSDRHLESMVLLLEQQEEKSHRRSGAVVAAVSRFPEWLRLH